MKKYFSKSVIKKNKGFTLIEILVVLSIIGLISSFIFVGLKSSRLKARDAKRIQEITQIIKALQLYWVANEKYPKNTCPCERGWEVSDINPEQFMEYLSPYLSEIPLDPINTRVGNYKFFGPRPENYFYAYQSYEAFPSYCPEIDKPFAVIGISNLEAYVPSDLPLNDMPLPLEISLPRAICGDPGPDGICTVEEYEDDKCRDWSQIFDYSVMLIE